ncbi:MAG: homocysteine S-methyltransferase family protein [Coriobacteriales bacterium]|nr:homocysteine S-methyltransferase family protein [Coriobacteriales bacterium]
MPDIMLRLGQEVLVAEGAMGTMLQRAGMPAGASPEQLNEMDSEMVLNVHRLYHMAGANCVKTNTFGGSWSHLAAYNLESRADFINREAVRIARKVRPEHILADMGPCGRNFAPVGDALFEENFREYAEQAASLAAENPDAILIETMTDIADARCALLAAKSVCELPVFVCCTFNEQGRMPLSGTDPATAAIILEESGADAVGINCGLGPEQVFPLFEQMGAATGLPLIVMPNAGMPRTNRRGQVEYPATPDDFARWAVRFAEAGAAVIGSCCGSTPAFTGAIKAMVGGRRVASRDVEPPQGLRFTGPRSQALVDGSRPFAIARIGDYGDAEGVTGAELEEAGDLAGEAADALEEGAQMVLFSLARAPRGQEETISALVDEVAQTAGCPLAFGSPDAGQLERALAAYAGRALVDGGVWHEGADAYRELMPAVKRYRAALIVRALAAGPEYQVDLVEDFLEQVLAAADEQGVPHDCLLVDVSSPRVGEEARVTLEAVARMARQAGCRVMLDTTTWSKTLRGASDGSERLKRALELGLDAVVIDHEDELVGSIIRHALG